MREMESEEDILAKFHIQKRTHLMIFVIPVYGKLMQVVLPGVHMHAPNVSKMGILAGRGCEWDVRRQFVSIVLAPTGVSLLLFRSQTPTVILQELRIHGWN